MLFARHGAASDLILLIITDNKGFLFYPILLYYIQCISFILSFFSPSLSLCTHLQECDLDDYSSAFFLLKQEDGEPKLVRRPPIKDIPPEGEKMKFLVGEMPRRYCK